MKLTIAILTYNGEELIGDCINSVLSQDIPCEHEILVIDNGSAKPFYTDNDRIKVVRLPRNYGNIGGQNACFDFADGELVLFISNDVRLKPNCIKEMVAFSNLHDRWVQIQPILFKPTGEIDNCGMDYRWPGYGIGRTAYTSHESPIVASICYLMLKSKWALHGGFDEHLPMAYEDVDFSLRANPSGYWSTVLPEAHAIHLGNATLRYTKADRWRFHVARTMVINKHFRGLDRLVRLLAVNIIDSITRLL